MTVEVDGPVVGQTGDGAIAGQIPDRTALNRDDRIVRYGGVALGYNGPSCQDICSRIYREFLRLFWALRYAASCFACVRNMP